MISNTISYYFPSINRFLHNSRGVNLDNMCIFVVKCLQLNIAVNGKSTALNSQRIWVFGCEPG